jgi:hypothetical protein
MEIQTTRGPGIGCETFEIIGGVPERETTVTGAMLMSAFVALSRAAEQKRTWRHQLTTRARPGLRTVLKAAGGNNHDAGTRMLLLKYAILRTGSADHIGHRPAVAFCQHPGGNMPWTAALFASCHRLLQFHRNFCQESVSLLRL